MASCLPPASDWRKDEVLPAPPLASSSHPASSSRRSSSFVPPTAAQFSAARAHHGWLAGQAVGLDRSWSKDSLSNSTDVKNSSTTSSELADGRVQPDLAIMTREHGDVGGGMVYDGSIYPAISSAGAWACRQSRNTSSSSATTERRRSSHASRPSARCAWHAIFCTCVVFSVTETLPVKGRAQNQIYDFACAHAPSRRSSNHGDCCSRADVPPPPRLSTSRSPRCGEKGRDFSECEVPIESIEVPNDFGRGAQI